MLKRINNDQWSSLFWLFCGAVICITAVEYGLGTYTVPGAGVMPFLAGLMIFICAFVGFVESTRRQRQGVIWESPIQEGAKWGRALLVVIILFLYTIFLERLGFTICTALTVIVLMRLGKAHKWSVAISVSIATAFIAHLIFVILLELQFPRGLWGF